MSPEQVLGRDADHRSDIFSLGVVLYQMATGQLPFSGKTVTETMDCILHVQPEAISRFNTVPAELERIVAKCLEKEPVARYQSAQELLSDLRVLKQALDTGSSVAPAQRQPSSISLSVRTALVLATAIACLGAAILVYMIVNRKSAATVSPQMRSLVVLPLQNLTGDPGQEYFVDGMTETLISNLANIKALRVISRTSAMHYKGTTRTLPQIADELKVDTVVEGSVQRARDRVRITVQLLEGPSDRHLWAGAYENDLRDVLLLQSQMAQAIANEIRIKLTPQEQTLLARARRVNPEAHEAYLKGRYFWNQWTTDSFERGTEYFERAVAKDPNYAAAYAGLADSYSIRSFYGDVSPEQAFPRAKVVALKALQLDPTRAETHTSLALVKQQYEWDWKGAEEEFKRAIELEPSSTLAHQMYAWHLSFRGRFEEAIAEMRRALELDPLSPVANTMMAAIYYMARDFDGAVKQVRATLKTAPNFYWAHHLLGEAYTEKGMYHDAIVELEKSIQGPTSSPHFRAILGYAHARAGQTREALALIENLKAESKRSYVPPSQIAIIYAGLSQRDQALAWLEKAYQEHDIYTTHIKVGPYFDPLRSDPRFQVLLQRMNFPQ